MRATLFVAVLALIMASAAPTTADTPTTFFVAEGETQTLAGTFHVDEVYLYGTLVAASDLTIVADVIHVASTASVEGADGSPIPWHGDGASVAFLAAKALTVVGSIAAGDGADMPASTDVVGADGGNGGSILLQAPSITVRDSARLTPGAGGAGSEVRVTAPQELLVQGGHGGDAGFVILDGATTIPDGSSVFGPANGGVGGAAHATDSPTGTLVRGGDGGKGALMATTDAAFLTNAPKGYVTFMTGVDPTEISWEVEPVTLNTAAIDPEFELRYDPPTKCKKGECPADDVRGIVEDPCGSLVDGSEGCLNEGCDYECMKALQKEVNDFVRSLPLEDLPGNPCEGQDTTTCALALVGIENEQDGCGDGADGAPATDTGTAGGDGGDGAHGTSGTPTGSPGGNGGAGNTGGAGDAQGGDGGNGRCWFSDGGDGGDGTATGGRGGNGGDGGNGGASTFFGAPGGRGGDCGAGGGALGVGGQGGKGGTFGYPGAPGKGISTPGLPGQGGKGGEGGAGFFPGPSGSGGACNTDVN